MNKFNNLYNKIIQEMMVAGGPASILGNPSGGEVGSHGGSVGNSDFWNPNSNVLAKSIFNGKIQKRNLQTNKKSSKNKNKK